MGKKEVLIKNWSFTCYNSNPYQAPETITIRLLGNAYGHENFVDGTPVCTSSILDVIDYSAYKIVETKNTLYKILPKDVDPEYELRFPNAYERLTVIKEV